MKTRRMMVEQLDARVSAASLFMGLDVFDAAGEQLDVTGGRQVEPGEQVTVKLFGRAQYEEGDRVNPNAAGGIFAWGVDVVAAADLEFQSIEAPPHTTAFALPYITQFDVPVDEYGTTMIDDLGGAIFSASPGSDQIYSTGEERVELATLTYTVADDAQFVGISLEGDDVDSFYAPLVYNNGQAAVDLVMEEFDSFWFSPVLQPLPDLHNDDCPADVNVDGVINLNDLLSVADDIYLNGVRDIQGAVDAETVPATMNDVNDDGTLNLTDALIVAGAVNAGATCDPVDPVEPADDGWDCETDGNNSCDAWEK